MPQNLILLKLNGKNIFLYLHDDFQPWQKPRRLIMNKIIRRSGSFKSSPVNIPFSVLIICENHLHCCLFLSLIRILWAPLLYIPLF